LRLNSKPLDLASTKDIMPLGKLTELNALYLSKNRISNISGLPNLHKLSSLYLDGNKVSDLRPLADIRNLSSLDLSGNQVSDLSPISNMKNLRYLSFNNNRLSELKPLVVMSKKDFEGEKSFAPYLFLAVNGNPLNAAAKTQLAVTASDWNLRNGLQPVTSPSTRRKRRLPHQKRRRAPKRRSSL
jgi:Leucine-rich repeat (LRR) protein